jgi:DNA-binding CsgD family transcriptional regulator
MILIEEKKYLELLKQAGQLDTPDKSFEFVSLMKEAYGFDHVSFATYDESADTYIRVSGTYPKERVDFYRSVKEREKIDPILRHLKRHKPFIWADMTDLTPEEKVLMSTSYRLGVGPNGFTIPFLSSDGRMSLLSATQNDISADDWRKKVSVQKDDLIEIGEILHAAMLTRIGVQPPSIDLSERSIACLKLKGCGMNEEQIARTLGISARSVKNHLKTAREALGTRNNEQAITFAFKLRFIPFPGEGSPQISR